MKNPIIPHGTPTTSEVEAGVRMYIPLRGEGPAGVIATVGAVVREMMEGKIIGELSIHFGPDGSAKAILERRGKVVLREIRF